MEIQLTRLKSTDLMYFKLLIQLFNEVFDEYHTCATDQHLNQLLAKPSFCAVVAMDSDVIVGGFTAYEMPRYYNDKSELYLYDIAIKENYQGKGIGKQLIQFLKSYSKNHHIETVFVEAYAEEEQAVKFYESTFGKAIRVAHFDLEIEKSE